MKDMTVRAVFLVIVIACAAAGNVSPRDTQRPHSVFRFTSSRSASSQQVGARAACAGGTSCAGCLRDVQPGINCAWCRETATCVDAAPTPAARCPTNWRVLSAFFNQDPAHTSKYMPGCTYVSRVGKTQSSYQKQKAQQYLANTMGFECEFNPQWSSVPVGAAAPAPAKHDVEVLSANGLAQIEAEGQNNNPHGYGFELVTKPIALTSKGLAVAKAALDDLQAECHRWIVAARAPAHGPDPLAATDSSLNAGTTLLHRDVRLTRRGYGFQYARLGFCNPQITVALPLERVFPLFQNRLTLDSVDDMRANSWVHRIATYVHANAPYSGFHVAWQGFFALLGSLLAAWRHRGTDNGCPHIITNPKNGLAREMVRTNWLVYVGALEELTNVQCAAGAGAGHLDAADDCWQLAWDMVEVVQGHNCAANQITLRNFEPPHNFMTVEEWFTNLRGDPVHHVPPFDNLQMVHSSFSTAEIQKRGDTGSAVVVELRNPSVMGGVYCDTQPPASMPNSRTVKSLFAQWHAFFSVFNVNGANPPVPAP